MRKALNDIVGERGEKIAELALTTYVPFGEPLFRTAFLGAKWPTIDIYVELARPTDRQEHFVAQIRATQAPLDLAEQQVKVQCSANEVARLRSMPGPTFLFAVHVPSQRVFAKSVDASHPIRSVSNIRLTNELTSHNLLRLHHEVQSFWATHNFKPLGSEFV